MSNSSTDLEESSNFYLIKMHWITQLEAPKIQMAKHISKELLKDGKMTKFLQEALTALPMKDLKEMNKKLKSLKMKREPGGDCIIVDDGKTSRRLHL